MTNSAGFDSLLNRMKDIKSGKYLPEGRDDTKNFLDCSYDIFSGWKNKFSLTNLQQVGVNGFESYINEFLPESGYGSWSGLARHKSDILNQINTLYANVITLLNSKGDMDQVKKHLITFIDPGSKSYFKGQTAFLLTSILFAGEECNFMVIDSPVREFYGIRSDKDAVDLYDCIIRISQSFAKSSGLRMWYINRAYAIHNNRDTIDLKRLNGKCLNYLTKNMSVHI